MIQLRVLIAVTALHCALPSLAQTPPQGSPQLNADRAQITACLRQGGAAAGASCIGLVAIACVRATAATRQREAELGCARREEAVWRDRLGLALQALSRSLDAGKRSRFASMQLAWESFTAQKCAFYGSVQPEGRQTGRQAGCELREVAQRTLELERFVTQPTAAPRPSGRPEIYR